MNPIAPSRTQTVLNAVNAARMANPICPEGEVWDPILRTCKSGKDPCPQGQLWDPILRTCKSGKRPPGGSSGSARGPGTIAGAPGRQFPPRPDCMATCTGGKTALIGYCWRKCNSITTMPTSQSMPGRLLSRAFRYLP